MKAANNTGTDNNQLLHDSNNMIELFQLVSSISADYLSKLDDHPTSLKEVPPISLNLPEKGLGAAETTELFLEQIRPLLLAASGPRYFGFVTGGGTPAAIAGDWLTAVFDQNTQFTNGKGDASAAVEQQTIRMLLHLFGLPQHFNGGFVTGATLSNFTCLAVARQWIGKQFQKDIAREGLQIPVKVYAAVPHSSSLKTLAMLGVGSSQVLMVPTLPDREAIDMEAFKQLLAAAPQEPFILISSGGTVNTVDYDDLEAIAALKEHYQFWWHIDAAFGAFAALSPQYRQLLSGWEGADSITVDCHKWLNVPYDSAVYFIQKSHALLQTQTFQNSNAPYLGDPMENFSYLNFGPENSRRFRALPVWFTLMAYGKQGYQQIVETNIQLARQLGEALTAAGCFKLLAPVRLNVVCFTTSESEGRNEKLKQILEKLYAAGKVFITPTVYKGTPGLRAALVNWRTTEKDIQITVDELVRAFG
ncbi:diaminobutyrate decarboxylase [Flammeovirgaceae bacterium 311]|nr:diaminobutyrate decarboxylase [Flammeovirgaceae bacterium 311]